MKVSCGTMQSPRRSCPFKPIQQVLAVGFWALGLCWQLQLGCLLIAPLLLSEHSPAVQYRKGCAQSAVALPSGFGNWDSSSQYDGLHTAH